MLKLPVHTWACLFEDKFGIARDDSHNFKSYYTQLLETAWEAFLSGLEIFESCIVDFKKKMYLIPFDFDKI